MVNADCNSSKSLSNFTSNLLVNFVHYLAQWFGDAEKLTKALFSFASKLAPVIIFVDEVRNCLALYHFSISVIAFYGEYFCDA